MGLRKYGPIPRGVFFDSGFLDLNAEARACFLSILGVCCYRGQFDRSPRLLDREIGWPAGRQSLGDVLQKMEGDAGVIRSYRALDAEGREVWVGEVVGYHALDGLPPDRINKQPPNPDFPSRVDPLPSLSQVSPRGLPEVSQGTPSSRVELRREERRRVEKEEDAGARGSASLHVSNETPAEPIAVPKPKPVGRLGKKQPMTQWQIRQATRPTLAEITRDANMVWSEEKQDYVYP